MKINTTLCIGVFLCVFLFQSSLHQLEAKPSQNSEDHFIYLPLLSNNSLTNTSENPTTGKPVKFVEKRVSYLLIQALSEPNADEGETIIAYLEHVAGVNQLSIKNIEDIEINDLNLLLRAANQFLEENPTDPKAAEISQLLAQLLPDLEQIMAADRSRKSKSPHAPLTSSYQVFTRSSYKGLAFRIAARDEYEPSAELLTVITEGIHDTRNALTSPDFSQLRLPNNLVITIQLRHDHEQPDTYAATALTEVNGRELCSVVLYLPGLKLPFHELKHTLAHEFFHCVQAKNFPGPYDGPNYEDNQYLLEQTAEWFITYVYPDFSYNRHISTFDATSEEIPLYEFQYDGLFFPKFLAQEQDVQAVLDYLANSPRSKGQDKQVEYLKQNYTHLFERFGQQYLDGTLLSLPFQPDIPEERMTAGKHTFECTTPFTICRAKLLFDAPTRLAFSKEGEGERSAADTKTSTWQPLPWLIDGDCTQEEYTYLFFGKEHKKRFLSEIDVGQGLSVSLPGAPFNNSKINGDLLGKWEIVSSHITTPTVASSLGGINHMTNYHVSGTFCFRDNGTVLANYHLDYRIFADHPNGTITQYVNAEEGRLAHFADHPNGDLLTGGFVGPSHQSETRITTGGLASTLAPYIHNSGTLDRDLFLNQPVTIIAFDYDIQGDRMTFIPKTYGQVPAYGIFWTLERPD